ncbi:hypothetical protein [Kitasatospora sp. NBC_01266]|uniref:hypothetical protein n=1 Tax=Kitasatospora sp. NBC_01266 TaxID=2903572 RepID=UPI002E30AA36|nr:hypothetical protein [Kitasatospora sp. NBC_01266]
MIRKRAMSIRSYRITSSGQRIELSSVDVLENTPDVPFSGTWPRCQCPKHREATEQKDTA